MGVLGDSRRSNTGIWIAGSLAAAAGTGCVLLGLEGKPKGLTFSHRVHVIEQELDCINCHEDTDMADEPGMPSADLCALCHADLDAEKPPERRVETLFDAESFRAARVALLDEEVIFSHLAHVTELDDCSACHEGIDENERVGPALAVSMQDCIDCHDDRGTSNECATCHTYVSEDWAPDSHHHNWKRRHGLVVRACTGQLADDCGLCHSEQTCIRCHQEELPEGHNAYFRQRGHGVFARMDRGNCAACHQADTCIRCHAEAIPVSHRGPFGSPRNAHCNGCHLPVQNEGCYTCHKSTPSHQLGAPKPAWHTPQMNCRQCHVPPIQLPHADNGTNCNLCHP